MSERANIVSKIFFMVHLPPDLRRRVHSAVGRGLRPGGVFLLEAYTPRQLEMESRGGPPPDQSDLLVTLHDLKEDLEGLEFELARELDREIHEGEYHRGLSAVVQVIARKSTS